MHPGACKHVGLAAAGPAAGSTGSKGLSFKMKQKLWTLAFVLALLRTRLDFFHGGTDGEDTQGKPFTLMKYIATLPQSSVSGSLELFPCDPVEELNFYLQQ